MSLPPKPPALLGMSGGRNINIPLPPKKPLYGHYRAITGGSRPRPPKIKRAVFGENSTPFTYKQGE